MESNLDWGSGASNANGSRAFTFCFSLTLSFTPSFSVAIRPPSLSRPASHTCLCAAAANQYLEKAAYIWMEIHDHVDMCGDCEIFPIHPYSLLMCIVASSAPLRSDVPCVVWLVATMVPAHKRLQLNACTMVCRFSYHICYGYDMVKIWSLPTGTNL